jgi:hypothetical protein
MPAIVSLSFEAWSPFGRRRASRVVQFGIFDEIATLPAAAEVLQVAPAVRFIACACGQTLLMLGAHANGKLGDRAMAIGLHIM